MHPEGILATLNLQEGDELEIILQDGCIVLRPVSNRWQEGEAEAQRDIDEGNVRRFSSLEDALRYLHDE